MSFDFQTATVCTHQVKFEKVELDTIIRKHIVLLRPPSNQKISVYINRVEVPKSGLYSFAKLSCTNHEPYRIQTGINDLIFIQVNNEIPKTIQLISGNVSSANLARHLQSKLPNLLITSENGRIQFSSRDRIKGMAFKFHDPTWTDKTSSLLSTNQIIKAYQTLGVIPGRIASGVLLYPGWITEPVPFSLSGETRVTFDFPILNHDPIFELNYTTNQINCRRCHSTGVEYDYTIINNTYDISVNADLLNQEWDKFLITKLGSHWKWNWLGSNLINRIGGKGSTGNNMIQTVITLDITQAFKTYQNVKKQQSQDPQQSVSDAEMPFQMTGILVDPVQDDPTGVIVSSVIVSKSREPIQLTKQLGNPNPFSLLGDPVKNIRLLGGRVPFGFRG